MGSRTRAHIQVDYRESKNDEVQEKRNQLAGTDIQQNYCERTKKEDGELLALKKRRRNKRKYIPISMLDEKTKEKRRRQNRECVQRHRERNKTTNEVDNIKEINFNINEANHLEEEKKKKDGKLFVVKEREKKKKRKKYVPVSMLDEKSKEKRRKQSRECTKRHREREKMKYEMVNIDKTNNLEEEKEKEDRDFYVLREKKRKKRQYIPISMLNEESKEKRRRQNRECVRRHREKIKASKVVNIEEGKKKEDGELFIPEERKKKKKKQKYVPVSMLDEQSKEKRRRQTREWRRLQRKRMKTINEVVNIGETNPPEEEKKKEDEKLFVPEKRERVPEKREKKKRKKRYVPVSLLDEKSKEKRRKQNRDSKRRQRGRKTNELYISHETNPPEEGKKDQEGERFLSQESEITKQKYIPISVLDEQSKTRKRKQSKESIRHYRENKIITDKDYTSIDETEHGMQEVQEKRNTADVQLNYHKQEKEQEETIIEVFNVDKTNHLEERKKKEDEEFFPLKERKRKKRKYIPISMLDDKSKEKRRSQNRESVRRHRERKKTNDVVNIEVINYHDNIQQPFLIEFQPFMKIS